MAERAPTLARVRDALAARIGHTSLRQVAREVGMSPSGLQNVIDGAESYPRTWKKLQRWYVRERTRHAASIDALEADVALDLLLDDLPPSARPAGKRAILRTLTEVYRGAEGAREAPAWITALMDRMADSR